MTGFLCPRCGEALAIAETVPQSELSCGTCGGLFATHGAVVELLTGKRALPSTHVHTSAHPYRSGRQAYEPANPLSDPVRYLPCPTCRILMNRNNFGGRSGVIVDICHRHGVWFDAHELAKVVDFVAAKGLPSSDALSEPRSPGFTFPAPPPSAVEVTAAGSPLYDAILELARFLRARLF